MPKDSQRFRKGAADELRASRKPGSAPDRSGHTKRAASYKALADNEEWLDGEKSRSKTKPPRHR
jgi:hypothetical protein